MEVYYKDNLSFNINTSDGYYPAIKTNKDGLVYPYIASTLPSATTPPLVDTNNIVCYYFDNKTLRGETLSSLYITVQRDGNENGPKVKETYAILYSFDEKRDWVELGEGTDIKTVTTQNYQTELYIHGVTMPGSNRYYSELAAEWPKMF